MQSNETMITQELKSLITKACALPHCPEGVRTALAHYLSTGQITRARDTAFGIDGSREADNWWLFYTSITDSAAALQRGERRIYAYWMYAAEDYFKYCESHDDPRE